MSESTLELKEIAGLIQRQQKSIDKTISTVRELLLPRAGVSVPEPFVYPATGNTTGNINSTVSLS